MTAPGSQYSVPMSESDARPLPTLDDAARHGLVGEIVSALEPHTEADSVALLISLLTGFGSAVGAGPRVMVGGAAHPARLFSAFVGRTAKARKGQSWADALMVLRVMDPEWAVDCVVSGVGSGEGLIAHVENEPGEEGRRALVVEEEFARLLTVARRQGSTVSHVIRQAWDGSNLHTLTAKPRTARDAHISIIGHVTEEELLRRLPQVDIFNGFANRFIWVCVDRSKILPTGGCFSEGSIATLGRALRERLDAARQVGIMRRSPGAEEYWGDLYRRLTNDDPPGILGAAVARAEPQVLRLSLVYALVDGSSMIEEVHLSAAEAVWAYSRQSAARLFSGANEDPMMDRLVVALDDAGRDGLDRQAQHRVLGNHTNAQDLARVRAALISSGRAAENAIPTGGRARYVLVASHHVPAEEATTAKEAKEAKEPKEATSQIQEIGSGGLTSPPSQVDEPIRTSTDDPRPNSPRIAPNMSTPVTEVGQATLVGVAEGVVDDDGADWVSARICQRVAEIAAGREPPGCSEHD